MLSSRGAITTNVALAECAAGQNTSDKSVFLLSELEKVWVAVAVVARRLLLDGSAVQIAPFGALWTEEYVLLRDRQQNPYKTRKLCFGINLNYANRYGVDTGKVPLERPGGEGYVRVSMADIVAVCGVPARVASTALKEFFLYLGEGLSRGRVLQLSLPGVATISMKKQKVVLSMDGELCIGMYEIDSRKWPGELQREGYEALQKRADTTTSSAFSSAVASRPSTSCLSRASWRAIPASTAGDGTEAKKPVFIAASPSGRLFDEIAQQEEQRRKASHSAALAEREMRRLQEDLDRRIERYDGCRCDADPVENAVNYTEATGADGFDDELRRVGLPLPSASGESVYDIITRSHPRDTAAVPNQSQQCRQRHPQSASSAPSHHHGVAADDEPEVEVIEIVDDSDMAKPPTMPAGNRPLARKDAELERILRDEEPFSRPISRRTYHESSAARDLIYSQPYEAPSRGAGSAATEALSPATHEKHTASIDTSAHTDALIAATRSGQTYEDVLRFGRKRFDSNQFDSDHIGTLLRYREY
ncbi:conserved hypothetical protein [Leishmania major strain Friedlin]|uniref:CCDC81 HU domain-containing protein n=1 Tax=Leishmania major TaxID=5664 RepID=Q4Q0B7_LEIMA|nr:conserved hypothetical protein [Leishmania major strain Friedlin]CAG9584202.1 Domain_of_unknown_function_(DUF4496)_-_putative [Leishmania major strain Friedlin]CAJ09618.1 conserved hypothetical protein [Leishmania major strain Friedlin]|eukprot:XP_001687231.1 conserved hypothetical protein [Leishmania major strain Friedlin]